MIPQDFLDQINPDRYIVPVGEKFHWKDYDPADTAGLKSKVEAQELLAAGIKKLAAYQDVLYAQNIYALLIIFQAMDAAGKDSTIKHVMSGINPQGCQVYSFKAPSAEELDHDFLWRANRALPERGCIGIFNRSYYEEVLVVRVHPDLLNRQQLPPETKTQHIWKERFEDINHYERYLTRNGILILKFFLNISKAEQKKRFLERIGRPEKNWKFSIDDVRDRAHWDDYREAYADVFRHTSTEWAPWHIIPANRKWFARLMVAHFIYQKLASLNLHYPIVSEVHKQQLLEAKALLENEPDED